MKGRFLLIGLIAVMLMAPALLGWSVPTESRDIYVFQLDEAMLSQGSGYSGVIPMDLSVMVVDSGDNLTDALNYLAAVPLAIRSNRTHTTSGLLLLIRFHWLTRPGSLEL